MNVRAGEPFRFWGCTEIRESLGVRAESERQLMERLETVPTESGFRRRLAEADDSSVYYHAVEAISRLEKPQNDFAARLETAVGLPALESASARAFLEDESQ